VAVVLVTGTGSISLPADCIGVDNVVAALLMLVLVLVMLVLVLLALAILELVREIVLASVVVIAIVEEVLTIDCSVD
jgi:hypothetical protein